MAEKFRDKPYYDSKSISTLDALSTMLGIPKKALIDLAENTKNHYHSFEYETNNGKIRQLNDPKFHLKKIQKRINSRIFSNFIFPQYLHGGIKEKDYFSNASAHAKAEFVYSFDIKGFYDHITKDHVLKIFKCLCRFSDDVSEILSCLVTLENKVPQGGVTSSNIANLVFFDDEYKLVSKFRSQGIVYTRLLDDIVVSSLKPICGDKKTKIAKNIISLIIKNKFSINEKKTKFVSRKQNDELMSVTGLWVNHSTPKCLKTERQKIRAAVHECEILFQEDEFKKTTEEYHKLWNKTSGRVAMLSRLGHSQAKLLRQRLEKILPTISEEVRKKLHSRVGKLEKLSPKTLNNIKYIKIANKLIYYCGILSRTHKIEAGKLRKRLTRLTSLKSYCQVWEE